MPRIAEIRELDGDIWVRIDHETLASDDGQISLYTPKEVEAVRRDERRACAYDLDEFAEMWRKAGVHDKAATAVYLSQAINV